MSIRLTATLLDTVGGWEPAILWEDKILARADRLFRTKQAALSFLKVWPPAKQAEPNHVAP